MRFEYKRTIYKNKMLKKWIKSSEISFFFRFFSRFFVFFYERKTSFSCFGNKNTKYLTYLFHFYSYQSTHKIFMFFFLIFSSCCNIENLNFLAQMFSFFTSFCVFFIKDTYCKINSKWEKNVFFGQKTYFFNVFWRLALMHKMNTFQNHMR